MAESFKHGQTNTHRMIFLYSAYFPTVIYQHRMEHRSYADRFRTGSISASQAYIHHIRASHQHKITAAVRLNDFEFVIPCTTRAIQPEAGNTAVRQYARRVVIGKSGHHPNPVPSVPTS